MTPAPVYHQGRCVSCDFVVVGIARYGRAVPDDRFLCHGQSFRFHDQRLMALVLSLTVDTYAREETTEWFVLFYGTAEHYDLTTDQIVNREHLPRGVTVAQTRRCWRLGTGGPVEHRC